MIAVMIRVTMIAVMIRILFATALSATALWSAVIPVRIAPKGQGYELLRDGKPYFIKGAGGTNRLDVLVESGGNSIRSWGPAPAVLDQAQAKGLTVLMGLRVRLPRAGFDYGDAAKVASQLEEARQTVRSMKDHPALLMWALGNEVELGVATEERPRLWRALDELARMVKEEDPHHPVAIVLAGIGGGKLAELKRYCPSIDAVGINAYGSMLTVPEVVAKEGWTKPYVVTEFGPRGHWEVEKTAWGMPLEDNSTQKAEFYRKAYEHAVSGQPQCLGAYVFLWGQKQEKTHTWYGMFLPAGNRTAAVDTLQYEWTGKWPADRSPRIDAVKVVQDAGQVRCAVEAADPENGPLTIKWDLRKDVADAPQRGGDREESVPALVEAQGRETVMRLPEGQGKYRVFVYIYDAAGNAATANVPVMVK